MRMVTLSNEPAANGRTTPEARSILESVANPLRAHPPVGFKGRAPACPFEGHEALNQGFRRLPDQDHARART